MKSKLIALEHSIGQRLPLRGAVQFVERAVLFLPRIWGRIRLTALVRDKGQGCVCSADAQLKYPQNISLGRRVIIGEGVTIGAHARVRLDDHVRLSKDVIIETAGLDTRAFHLPLLHISKPIRIGQGTWIGSRAIVLGGVEIGARAVVAAGAVVTRDVEDGQTVAGNPARPIRTQTGTDRLHGQTANTH